MPAISKQTTSAKPVASYKPIANGSLLSQGVQASDLVDEFVKMVIYGQNRTGKTTLACEFPKPLALVCFEPAKSGGARSISKVEGVTVYRISSRPDPKHTKAVFGLMHAAELCKEIAQSMPFKTVVLDSATSYQDIVLQDILQLEEMPEQLNWGTVTRDQYRERSEKTREALRPWLNLDCNVVVLAKERDHNPPDKETKPGILRGIQQESFFASDLGGATVGWLHDACDYLARLYMDKETREIVHKPVTVAGKTIPARVEVVETGKTVRRLRTMYHSNYAAGFRSCNPEAVPEYIEAKTPKEMYDEVMKVISGIKSSKGKYN